MRSQKQAASIRLQVILIIAVFLIGAGVFLYPDISNCYIERHQADVIQVYEDTVEEIPQEALEAEKEAVREYNRSLLHGQVILTDPFDENAVRRDAAQYEQRLALDETMAYIEIPKIDVYLPIYHGTDKETLEKGIGHLENTSLPMGGEGTHCVLSGHTGLPMAKLFTDLDQLEVGDEFYIYVLDENLAYEVDQIKVVEPDDISSLGIDSTQDYVTLITCTPYGKNTHRLLVRGHRTEYSEKAKEEAGNTSAKNDNSNFLERWLARRVLPLWMWIVLAAAGGICIGLLITGRKKRAKKDRRQKHRRTRKRADQRTGQKTDQKTSQKTDRRKSKR